MAAVETLCACGAPATSGSIRNECGECFRARLRSVRLDTSVLETRTKVNYFDSQAADETFGEDRVDHYWEMTGGHGSLNNVNGKLYHRDYKGEVHEATDEVVNHFVEGTEAEDVV